MCDAVKYNRVSDKAVRLRLVPFALRDKAKVWLNSQTTRLYYQLGHLVQNFLEKFFSLEKIVQLKMEIHGFFVHKGEPMHAAWDRYKELLKMCPHHGVSW